MGVNRTNDEILQATWAAAVFLVTREQQWYFQGYVTSNVQTDPSNGQYCGAQSNSCGAAEATAELWAAKITIALPLVVPTIIRPDSLTAEILVTSKAILNMHTELIDTAAVLWTIARNNGVIIWQHVPAHTNEPYNDLADSLCC